MKSSVRIEPVLLLQHVAFRIQRRELSQWFLSFLVMSLQRRGSLIELR